MRVAPPVQALSCSAGPWLSIQSALYALSTAVAVWWAGAQLGAGGAALAFVSLGLGLLAASIARRALASPAWRLDWDGGSWRLQAPGREDRVGCVVQMLDLGAWVLVRFSPQYATRPRQGAMWLPLSRCSTASAWPALRVALYAPQPVRPAA
jgi:hypothetical protein